MIRFGKTIAFFKSSTNSLAPSTVLLIYAGSSASNTLPLIASLIESLKIKIPSLRCSALAVVAGMNPSAMAVGPAIHGSP